MTLDRTNSQVRIVVTGAAGQLGTRACAALRLLDGVQVVALDSAPKDREIQVDLLAPLTTWAHHFAGADAVLHLAGDSSPEIDEATARREIDGMTANVLNAATRHNVPRILYASSCQVLAGATGHAKLNGTTPAAPLNPYGRAKARMENAGQVWATEPGRAFLALRIGMCLGIGRPTPDMQLSLWKQRIWLAPEDWDQAVLRACFSSATGYRCVTLTSHNTGTTWDLSHARDAIGYWPNARRTPRSRHFQQAAHLTQRIRRRLIPERSKIGASLSSDP